MYTLSGEAGVGKFKLDKNPPDHYCQHLCSKAIVRFLGVGLHFQLSELVVYIAKIDKTM